MKSKQVNKFDYQILLNSVYSEQKPNTCVQDKDLC